MRIYDLSPEISENMVVYKNKAEKKSLIKRTSNGANESRIELDSHTGSHADAPFHFLNNGKTIDAIDLDKFFGNAIVLDLTKVKDSIKESDLLKFRNKIKNDEIILLKTKNKTSKVFDFNFVYLEKSAAEFLASMKVKAVGIDSLGIERNQPNHETHTALLEKNVIIFEGLDLSKVKEGKYTFFGFPLKLKKGDASPVRAVLLDQSNDGHN